MDEIAELKKIIEKQKEQIFQLKSVIADLPGSLYWKDKEGHYLGRNETSARSLRSMNFPWKEEDIVGKTDYDLFSKEMADLFRKHDLEVMQSGQESTQEETTYLPSGEQVIQLSTKRPLYDEHGHINGIVGNTVDISYLKKIETELRQAKEKAEQATAIKMEFIRNMEHDIRTPFNGVWRLAEILWQQENDVTKKELLGDITLCAKELLDYCNGILDFSKVEAGTLAVLAKKFELKELLENIIKIEMPAAKIKNIGFSFDFDSSLPKFLIGDNYRLLRVLLNLTSNAIKFTHEGHVILSVKKVKLEEQKIILNFIVEDTGIGIPQDKQDFIYEKFSRLNPSNKGIYKGLGLGLRVVKQFIEEMEGEIEVKSSPSKGTTFICTLPFKLSLSNE